MRREKMPVLERRKIVIIAVLAAVVTTVFSFPSILFFLLYSSCVCVCLYVSILLRKTEAACVIYTVPNNTHSAREGEREKEREAREAQDRIKSSSSSLIPIHFFDYINARKKK
jgi:hypothetical protein